METEEFFSPLPSLCILLFEGDEQILRNYRVHGSPEHLRQRVVSILNKDAHTIDYCLTRDHTTFIDDSNHRLYYKDLYRLNRDLVGTDSESDD